MAKIQLTLACGAYDLTRGLIDGSIAPQGIELVPLTMGSPERHFRMTHGPEFDVCEFSMASYLAAREAGLPFTAIPAFPHRRFRHSYMFVNTKAGIREPADLAGKRVVNRTWQTTACVWMRGILQSEYGLALEKVHWVMQSAEDIALDLPAGIHVEQLPPDVNLDTALVEGELDAALYPEMLPSFLKGDPRVGQLFPDPKAAEQEYYRKTGIFPIMHTVVIRNDVLERHPWVALSLFQAFQKAKEQAYTTLQNPRTVALAWVIEALEEQRAILGPDPWPYGFEPNRHNLTTFCNYGYEQGLTKRRIDPAELFVPNTLQEIPRYVE